MTRMIGFLVFVTVYFPNQKFGLGIPAWCFRVAIMLAVCALIEDLVKLFYGKEETKVTVTLNGVPQDDVVNIEELPVH